MFELLCRRFGSFPDSNSIDHSGDSTHCFRLRSGQLTRKLYNGGSKILADSQDIMTLNNASFDGYTYGYVFFRQKPDFKNRRGYFQKSVTLLSSYPWKGLFLHICRRLGERVLVPDLKPSIIKECIVQICQDISSWVHVNSTLNPYALCLDTIHGKFCKMPFSYRIDKDTISFSDTLKSVDPSFEPCHRYFEIFGQQLDCLWTIWELVLVGEPLIVFSESPSAVSEIVWSLINIIRPVSHLFESLYYRCLLIHIQQIPYGGDFRPFLTIQDADSKLFSSKEKAASDSIILGVTNPVFLTLLSKFPNSICSVAPEKISNFSSFKTPTSP